MASYLDRCNELLGEEKITSFKDKTILIVGLGGVGGTALNALARSGFNHFIIVDKDVVDITNINRQIMYTSLDVNRNKVDVCEEALLKINPEIKVEKHCTFIDENSINELKDKKIDFIVDAIDYIPGKIALIKLALEKHIPFIVSLGMGNRIDGEKVTITKLNKTENDPLAKKIRYLLRQDNIDLKNINVVFSKEIPLVKQPHPASMIMVPSQAGLLIAKYAIENI